MKHTSLFCLLLLLLSSSCGPPRKRFESTRDLANALLDALKENDEKKFLALYPTLSECKKVSDDLIDTGDVEDSDDDDDDDNSRHHKDGLSETQLKRYFEDSREKAKKMFRDLIDDAKDKDVSWKTAKVTDTHLPHKKSRHSGEQPTWMRIAFKDSHGKHFSVELMNCFKTDEGWNIGLEVKLSEYVWDDDGDDVSSSIFNNNPSNNSYTRQQAMADSIRLADSIQVVTRMRMLIDSMRADSIARARRYRRGP